MCIKNLTANAVLEDKKNMGYVKKKTKTKSEIWLTIVSIILVAVVVASIVTAALSNTGVFLRISDAVKTENYEVDGAMMNYFFNEELSSWISNNYTYLQYAAIYPSYFGDYVVDFSSDLDAQECKLIASADKTEDYHTWYDYFMGMAMETVSRYMEYAEGAKMAGVKLDDSDMDSVDEQLNTLMSNLKANDYKIEDVYGKGTTKADIKKCLELKELAVKYAEIKIEELKDELEGNDKAVFDYPAEHKSEFFSAEYVYYTIQVKEESYKTDAEYESAKLAAKSAAELIAKAETPELFFEALVKYETEKKEAEQATATTVETTTSATTGTGTTAAETTTKAPELDDYTKEVFYNTNTDELNKWLFVEEAEDGAYKVIEETETVTTKATSTTKATEETTSGEATTTAKTSKEVYKVTAYKVIKSNDLNRNKTFDLGYVVTTDKAVMEKIYNDFSNGAEKTAEILEKLGIAAADNGAELDAKAQENAMPEYFDGFSDDLDKWLNSKDLKAGSNSGIIEVKPTTDGAKTQYALVHFDNFGDEIWYSDAFDAIMDERFEAWYESMKTTKPISTKANTLEKMSVSSYVQYMASQIQSSASSSLS